MAAKPYVIALEEHYLDPEIKQATGRTDAIGPRQLIERLDDLGELRLREMDDAGIDFQVLSHSIPGLQGVDAATGVPLARRANDRLPRRCGLIPTASPVSRRCRPPTRALPPTNWSAPSRSSASRAR